MDVVFTVGVVANLIYVLHALYKTSKAVGEPEIKKVTFALLVIVVCTLALYACFEMDGIPCFFIKRN